MKEVTGILQKSYEEERIMTLRPMFIKCARCKKTYSWNPDVGKLCCPRCGLIGNPGWTIPKRIMTSGCKKRK